MTEQRIINCPFCRSLEIVCSYTPKTLVTHYSRAASNKKVVRYYKDEKYSVLSSKCTCGKTGKEIQDKLTGNSSVKVSDALKRAMENGLPTRF